MDTYSVSSEYETTALGNHLQYLTLSLLKRKILNRNNIINSFLNAFKSFNPSLFLPSLPIFFSLPIIDKNETELDSCRYTLHYQIFNEWIENE